MGVSTRVRFAPAAPGATRTHRRLTRQRTLLALAAVAAAAFGLGTYLTGTFTQLEDASLATRFALRGPSRPADIVIVAIDERTFSALRLQWPFPRSLHARLIDRLHADGARAIVY